MRQQFRQIWPGMFQRQNDSVGPWCRDPQGCFRQFAAAMGLGVPNDPEIRGVARRRFRIQQAAKGEIEIRGRHRLAVRPLRVTQMEGPGQAVLRHRPAFGHAGDRLRRRIQRGQAHHQIADDIVLGLGRREGGIERFRFAAIAAIERGGLRRQGAEQQQKESKTGSQNTCVRDFSAPSMRAQRAR